MHEFLANHRRTPVGIHARFVDLRGRFSVKPSLKIMPRLATAGARVALCPRCIRKPLLGVLTGYKKSKKPDQFGITNDNDFKDIRQEFDVVSQITTAWLMSGWNALSYSYEQNPIEK